MEKTGLPEEVIHEKAHVLEHISDQATVEYLDDKLGHPLIDPHGSEIPEDPVQLHEGKNVMSSLLREGWKAEIRKIKKVASQCNLKVGDRITMGPRSQNGKIWTILRENGETLELDHRQADAVIVRILDN